MPDDKLISSSPPPEDGPTGRPPVPSLSRDVEMPLEYEEGFRQQSDQGLNVQRYVTAIVRRKWLLILALLIGLGGAAGAYAFLGVEYTAQANLWVQVEQRGQGDVGPIRQGELLNSYAWIQLLKSFAVLDPVVVAQRLYLSLPREFARAFEGFSLADQFRPGAYVLEIGDGRERFTLTSDQGAVIQSGTLGDSIGSDLGFQWAPEASSFTPGAEVRFRVTNPRDASRGLQEQLQARMDPNGNFIALSLSGTDPVRIATVLNGLMDRYVELAAQLKRRKLDEEQKILEDQLQRTQQALAEAERQLEAFRVQTITLPSDASTPIAPGLELTRGPVFNRFFQMKIDLEQIQRDRVQLEKALDSFDDGSVRIELLEAIPEVGESAEMSQALNELVQLRAQLRTLRNDFTDDYPPIQDVLKRIATIEHESIPRMAGGLLAELQAKETRLSNQVDSASSELSQIPPRTIEEARLRRQVSIQENLYNELRSRVETARLAAAGTLADVQILDRAAVPQVPTSDDRLRFGAIILFGSLGAGIGLAILLDRMDRRIQYADEVDSAIGLDILASIPRIRSVTGRGVERNAAQVVEAFRELRMTVQFAHGAAGPVIVAVSSPAQGEGKTLITTNLAVAFAEMGKRTLLIDADTRRGDAHRLLGLKRKPGLADYLRDRSHGDVIQTTEYTNLEFIGSGTRGTSTPELLASQRMAAFMGTLKRAYDVILIDCPPLAAGADALVLAGLSGELAVVLRTGSTDKRLTVMKLETLSRLPIRVLGAILNDVERTGDRYGYYGSYLPGYEARREEEDGDAEQPARLLSTAQAPDDGEL